MHRLTHSALLVAGCLLWMPLQAQADDIIRYRTQDGSIGFAQDASGVPLGATLIDAPTQAPRTQIQNATPPASPRSGPPKFTPEMLGMPAKPKPDPWGNVLRESEKQEAIEREERRRAAESIRKREKNLERLGQQKKNACAKMVVDYRNGKAIKRRVNSSACSHLRNEQKRAKSDYDQHRANVDDELNGDLDFELEKLDEND